MSEIRPLCSKCGKHDRAINYKKNDRIYYRSCCESCLNLNIKRSKSLYVRKGYKKKLTCEACSFIPKHPDQLTVISYKDNFRTICLNCDAIVKVTDQLFSGVKADY
jgi:hypothetical protein